VGTAAANFIRDKLDYELFLKAMAEVCEWTGWRPHAWVLLEKVQEPLSVWDRGSYGGGAVREHDESEAKRLVRRGLTALGLPEGELAGMLKGGRAGGHPGKCALARVVHTRTMASHKWLTARLHMEHPQNLTGYVKQTSKIARASLARLEENT
jgi:hypothetical protein